MPTLIRNAPVMKLGEEKEVLSTTTATTIAPPGGRDVESSLGKSCHYRVKKLELGLRLDWNSPPKTRKPRQQLRCHAAWKVNRLSLKSAQQQGRCDVVQHARHIDLVSTKLMGFKIPNDRREVKFGETTGFIVLIARFCAAGRGSAHRAPHRRRKSRAG